MHRSPYRKGFMQHLQPAFSVYGGAGGHGTRISTPRGIANSWNELTGENLFFGNEKALLQSLNGRLASYLDKVQALEMSNSKLEAQIKQWYETNHPRIDGDYSTHYKQIEELQKQIKDAQLKNAQYRMRLDSVVLRATMVRQKYESERELRETVKADIAYLTKFFDDLTLCKADLESQIEDLTGDSLLLRKEHEEEVNRLHERLGKNVSVELDAAPGLSLRTIMNEMRQKYEDMVQKNLQEVKEQFEKQTKALQQQVSVNTEEMKGREVQVNELKLTYQSLKTELQSHLSMKKALKNTLEETKAQYHAKLASIWELLSSLEAKLMKIRKEAEHQRDECNTLLDIKTRLEQEIATYRHLLKGKDLKLSTPREREVKKMRKIKAIMKEVVNDKVVSSTVFENVEEEI